MPTSSKTGISAQKNVPILCLDTCAILDILRDPTRRDVRIHEHEASLGLEYAPNMAAAKHLLGL